MQYVPFGQLVFSVSRLGFGMMRLPVMKKENGDTCIDREKAIAMIRHGIDSGINYIDTAYPYHGGESEIVVGEALKNGYREKVTLTTKLPVWKVKTKEDMDAVLNEQLQKLQTDHVDFYLMHALDKARFEKLQQLDYQEFLDRAKADGRIRHAGFSFHDNYEAFKEIIDDYPWDMAQVQMNYLDDQNQATVEGIRYAGKKGIPIVIMEPLRGGALANPPKEVLDKIAAYPQKMSPVKWAFRYLADMPEVALILSGMSTMEQLDDNLAIFDTLTIGNLSEDDRALLAELKKIYYARMPIGCTHCEYCQPCPKNVHIPDLFEDYNECAMFDRPERFIHAYAGYKDRKEDASLCVSCGACEKICPQHLPIRQWLQKLDKEYEEGKQ